MKHHKQNMKLHIASKVIVYMICLAPDFENRKNHFVRLSIVFQFPLLTPNWQSRDEVVDALPLADRSANYK